MKHGQSHLKGMHNEEHISVWAFCPSLLTVQCCWISEGQDRLCCGQAIGAPDQVSTRQKQIHDRTPPSCVPAKFKDNLRAVGASEGQGGEYSVQWLTGPLLCGTEEDISKNAECITLKDLSQRSDTSSDVRPFVSILGRIFNLMVPDLNCFSFRR